MKSEGRAISRLFVNLLTIIFFNIVSVGQAHAATLHAILVGDTIGAEYEFGGNLDAMKREVKKIAALTGLELNACVYEGMQVRKDSIISTIAKLNIQPDDAIILCFNMHGSRSHNKMNRWPDLDFKIDIGLIGEGGHVDFNDINQLVKSKNPRFLLSIADSCNAYRNEIDFDDEEEDNEEHVVVSVDYPDPPYERIGLSEQEIDFLKNSADEDDLELYRHLFLEYKGSVVISASSPGETAIKWPVTGGVYTTNLLRSLCYASMNCNTQDWKEILEQASLETEKEIMLKEKTLYTPQYEMQ